MNTSFAAEYIARRMAELGHGSDYILRMRHLLLQPHQEITLQGPSHLFVLVEPFSDVRMESHAGIFDMSEQTANELQYEHRGVVKLQNLAQFVSHVRLIQAIPVIQ